MENGRFPSLPRNTDENLIWGAPGQEPVTETTPSSQFPHWQKSDGPIFTPPPPWQRNTYKQLLDAAGIILELGEMTPDEHRHFHDVRNDMLAKVPENPHDRDIQPRALSTLRIDDGTPIDTVMKRAIRELREIRFAPNHKRDLISITLLCCWLTAWEEHIKATVTHPDAANKPALPAWRSQRELTNHLSWVSVFRCDLALQHPTDLRVIFERHREYALKMRTILLQEMGTEGVAQLLSDNGVVLGPGEYIAG